MRGPTCIFWADLTPFSLQIISSGDVECPPRPLQGTLYGIFACTTLTSSLVYMVVDAPQHSFLEIPQVSSFGEPKNHSQVATDGKVIFLQAAHYSK